MRIAGPKSTSSTSNAGLTPSSRLKSARDTTRTRSPTSTITASTAARWLHLTDTKARPEIVAVCDLNPGLTQWFADNVPSVAQVTDDYQALLQEGQPRPQLGASLLGRQVVLEQDLHAPRLGRDQLDRGADLQRPPDRGGHDRVADLARLALEHDRTDRPVCRCVGRHVAGRQAFQNAGCE